MSLISVGASLPLALQLHDGATGKFVRAHVRNQAGTAVTGSPFALTHVAQGLYTNSAYTVLISETKLTITYITYDDAGFTTESVFHTRAAEMFDVETQVETARTDVLTRLGTPAGASVSADIAAIQTKLGTPAGASVSADIAAVQTKLGTPAGASVSADIAAVQTKLGTPAGASVSADIASVKSDSSTILGQTGTTGVVLVDNAITANKIASAAITAAKFAAGAIDANAIASAAITAAKFAANAIDSTVVADNTVTAAKIASAAITSAKFAAGAIDANAIAAAAITSAKFAAGAIDASAIASAAITSAKFAANAIDSTVVADNTITAAKIASAAITSAKFAAGAIDANAIASAAITSAKFAAGAIDASAIASAAITAAKFAANAIDSAALATSAATEIAAAVWDESLASHTTAGSMGFNQNLIDDIEADTSSLNDTKITTGRANNLDNLDATISSRATQASVDAIQNNTRFAMVVPTTLILPTSGTQDYKFYGRLFDETGNPEDPDSNTINIRIETPGGTVVVATTAMTRTAVGRYEYLYTVNSSDTERPLVVFMEYAENSVSFQQVRTTEVQEFESKLDTLLGRLTSTRAGYLDNLPNLDATVSSRQSAATALSQYNALQADTDDIQSKIGSPVGTLASDIASVQADTDDIQSKIGTPVTSVSADIASVQSDTTTLTSRLTALRAGYLDNLPNLDATVSSRQSAATALSQYSALQADTDDIQSKIGIPVGTLASDIAGVQSTANTINGKLGTPVVSVSDDIAAVKADTAAILDDTGTTGVVLSAAAEAQLVDAVWDELQAGHATAGSFGKRLDVDVSTRESDSSASTRNSNVLSAIAGVQADTDDIQSKIGSPVVTVSADIAALQSSVNAAAANVTAIKAQTDQFTFTGANVNANAQVVSDKTNYALSSASRAAIVDEVWDELLAAHLAAGTAGKALYDVTAAGATPAAIAAEVWDTLVTPHNLANTFGNYIQVIRQSGFSAVAELTDAGHGLNALYTQAGNLAANTVAEVNQNETKIDAIIPYVAAQTTSIIAEVDQNQTLIGSLSTQLTAAKADILSAVGTVGTKVDAVALQIGTIQNNTTVRFIVPDRLIKPNSGTKTYQFHLRLYDDTGHAQAPDSTPTIRIRRLDTNVDIVLNAPMTQDGVKVGAYYYDFSITSGTAEYQALVEATVVENGATRYIPAVTEVTEFESDLNAIQAQLTAVQATVVGTDTAINSGVYGLAALKTGQTNIITEVNQNETLILAVKARTDLIPASPATSAQVSAVSATVLTRPSLAEIVTELNLVRDYLAGPDNRNLTAVYNKIDFTPIAKTNDPRFNYLDAAISSRSTLDAAAVWAYGTRTLTGFTLPVASVKAIWDYLASQATVVGSLGKLLVDNLDASVSSRATSAQMASLLAGVAQESTVSSLAGLITSGDNQTQIDLAAVAANVLLVKGKTQNLPSDPASASAVASGFAAQTSTLGTIDLKTTGIKAKTDNLPPDPAKETSVLARPTNPVLASDARLNRLDVNVSTRGTANASDLTPLATSAALAASQAAIISEINVNETKINAVQATANLIKAKTDLIPSQPVSKAHLDASTAEILDAIDDIPSGGGGASAADVWTYPSRTITQDPQSFGPDISDLATHEDVENININTAGCKMSTTLNSTDGTHEVIVWLEKNGVPFLTASNARVKVKSTEGATLWEANLASPTADGVFAFSMAFTPPDADRNYYVEMVISDGTNDFSGRAAFITVG